MDGRPTCRGGRGVRYRAPSQDPKVNLQEILICDHCPPPPSPDGPSYKHRRNKCSLSSWGCYALRPHPWCSGSSLAGHCAAAATLLCPGVAAFWELICLVVAFRLFRGWKFLMCCHGAQGFLPEFHAPWVPPTSGPTHGPIWGGHTAAEKAVSWTRLSDFSFELYSNLTAYMEVVVSERHTTFQKQLNQYCSGMRVSISCLSKETF